MIGRPLRYFYSAATELVSNKIKVLVNGLFRGVNIKIKNVNLVGTITLKQLHLTKLDLDLSPTNGNLSAHINMSALINDNIEFECWCNIESKFKQIEAQLVIEQLKAQIKSKSDPIISMVLQNSINEYITKFRVRIPEKVRMMRELVRVEEQDENDVVVVDYGEYKNKEGERDDNGTS